MTAFRDRKAAERAWKIFHQKQNPVIGPVLEDPNGVWPKHWECVGLVETVYYRSNKWYKDGKWFRYYHDHGPDVRVWHPVGSRAVRSLKGSVAPCARPLPIKQPYPDALAILGDSLGWRMQSGKLAEVDDGELLCCTPDMRKLVVLNPSSGLTAVFSGPSLRVEARGVVG